MTQMTQMTQTKQAKPAKHVTRESRCVLYLSALLGSE
jgi:hypothetical protein